MAAGIEVDGTAGVGRRHETGDTADDVEASEGESFQTEEEVEVLEAPTKNAVEIDPQATVLDAHDKARARLQELCSVLGLNFKKKLSEFGTGELTLVRMDEAIRFLEHSKEINFRALKQIAGNLLDEWESNDTSFKRMEKFSWILATVDATTVDQVIVPDALSTDNIKRAVKEVELLQKERTEKKTQKYKTKYLTRKKTLMKMLSESHLLGSDVCYDPLKQVSAEDYKEEAKNVKTAINVAKLFVADRKHMVLRVELLKKGVVQRKPLEDVKALCGHAMSAAKKLSETIAQEIKYDGQMVEDLINSLLRSAEAEAAEQGDVAQKPSARATRSTTRAARSSVK